MDSVIGHRAACAVCGWVAERWSSSSEVACKGVAEVAQRHIQETGHEVARWSWVETSQEWKPAQGKEVRS